MTMDPNEKDALQYLPNAGRTILGQMGVTDNSQPSVGRGNSGQSKAVIFRSEGDPRVQVIADPAGQTTVVVTLDPSGGQFRLSESVTTTSGRPVANRETAVSGANWVDWLTLPPGTYNLRVAVKNLTTNAVKQSSVTFTVQ